MRYKDNSIIQKIFQSYLPQLKNIKLPLKDIKAIEAITTCRTLENGYNYLACPEGHEDKITPHSCRHRSCSICSNKARYEWIESEKTRLLNCPHHHVIFTLPHMNTLIYGNTIVNGLRSHFSKLVEIHL